MESLTQPVQIDREALELFNPPTDANPPGQKEVAMEIQVITFWFYSQDTTCRVDLVTLQASKLSMLILNYFAFTVCPRPKGWCTHSGSTYTVKDCDGDEVPDPTCSDSQGNFGIIPSSNGCKSTWPKGSCNGDSGKYNHGGIVVRILHHVGQVLYAPKSWTAPHYLMCGALHSNKIFTPSR